MTGPGIPSMLTQGVVQPEKHDPGLLRNAHPPSLLHQLRSDLRRCDDHGDTVVQVLQCVLCIHKGAEGFLNFRHHQSQRGEFLFIFQLEIILRQQLRQYIYNSSS